MKTERVLAIDPGTRAIGIAVLQDRDLLYYGVKTIKGLKTPREVLQKVDKIINQQITNYEPATVAIEKMFLIQKNASFLIVVADEIKAIAKQQGLAVCEFAPTAVRKLICQAGKATKREVAKIIASRYVELTRYLNRPSKWEELYYANMFDAIAVGLVCQQKCRLR
jgi:crossover junction endodeoxyribonuclease RuvC